MAIAINNSDVYFFAFNAISELSNIVYKTIKNYKETDEIDLNLYSNMNMDDFIRSVISNYNIKVNNKMYKVKLTSSYTKSDCELYLIFALGKEDDGINIDNIIATEMNNKSVNFKIIILPSMIEMYYSDMNKIAKVIQKIVHTISGFVGDIDDVETLKNSGFTDSMICLWAEYFYTYLYITSVYGLNYKTKKFIQDYSKINRINFTTNLKYLKQFLRCSYKEDTTIRSNSISIINDLFVNKKIISDMYFTDIRDDSNLPDLSEDDISDNINESYWDKAETKYLISDKIMNKMRNICPIWENIKYRSLNIYENIIQSKDDESSFYKLYAQYSDTNTIFDVYTFRYAQSYDEKVFTQNDKFRDTWKKIKEHPHTDIDTVMKQVLAVTNDAKIKTNILIWWNLNHPYWDNININIPDYYRQMHKETSSNEVIVFDDELGIVNYVNKLIKDRKIDKNYISKTIFTTYKPPHNYYTIASYDLKTNTATYNIEESGYYNKDLEEYYDISIIKKICTKYSIDPNLIIPSYSVGKIQIIRQLSYEDYQLDSDRVSSEEERKSYLDNEATKALNALSKVDSQYEQLSLYEIVGVEGLPTKPKANKAYLNYYTGEIWIYNIRDRKIMKKIKQVSVRYDPHLAEEDNLDDFLINQVKNVYYSDYEFVVYRNTINESELNEDTIYIDSFTGKAYKVKIEKEYFWSKITQVDLPIILASNGNQLSTNIDYYYSDPSKMVFEKVEEYNNYLLSLARQIFFDYKGIFEVVLDLPKDKIDSTIYYINKEDKSIYQYRVITTNKISELGKKIAVTNDTDTMLEKMENDYPRYVEYGLCKSKDELIRNGEVDYLYANIKTGELYTITDSSSKETWDMLAQLPVKATLKFIEDNPDKSKKTSDITVTSLRDRADLMAKEAQALLSNNKDIKDFVYVMKLDSANNCKNNTAYVDITLGNMYEVEDNSTYKHTYLEQLNTENGNYAMINQLESLHPDLYNTLCVNSESDVDDKNSYKTYPMAFIDVSTGKAFTIEIDHLNKTWKKLGSVSMPKLSFYFATQEDINKYVLDYIKISYPNRGEYILEQSSLPSETDNISSGSIYCILATGEIYQAVINKKYILTQLAVADPQADLEEACQDLDIEGKLKERFDEYYTDKTIFGENVIFKITKDLSTMQKEIDKFNEEGTMTENRNTVFCTLIRPHGLYIISNDLKTFLPVGELNVLDDTQVQIVKELPTKDIDPNVYYVIKDTGIIYHTSKITSECTFEKLSKMYVPHIGEVKNY